jgi:hypothetical protein
MDESYDFMEFADELNSYKKWKSNLDDLEYDEVPTESLDDPKFFGDATDIDYMDGEDAI